MFNFEPYEARMNALMRLWIEEHDHIVTGNLYRSIDYRVYVDEQGHIIGELFSEPYIVYLQDGNFLDMFYDDPDVNAILDDMFNDYLEWKLDNAANTK